MLMHPAFGLTYLHIISYSFHGLFATQVPPLPIGSSSRCWCTTPSPAPAAMHWCHSEASEAPDQWDTCNRWRSLMLFYAISCDFTRNLTHSIGQIESQTRETSSLLLQCCYSSLLWRTMRALLNLNYTSIHQSIKIIQNSKWINWL